MMIANATVAPGVSKLLPDVLIEYLWKLVFFEEQCAGESQLLTLRARKLGGGDVQDIYCERNEGASRDCRRVFGVEPVNCRLQVLHTQGGAQMLLCEG